MKKSLVLLLLLCSFLPAFGESGKIAVVFDCECTDSVGARYATEVRDLLAASPRYYLAYSAEEKDKNGKISSYHWHFKVLSLDPSSNNDGSSTVLSVVLLVGDSIFMTQQVQTCGASRISACAANTISFMDGFINSK